MERANAGSRLQEQPGSAKPNDVSYTLPITIEELFNGNTKKLLIQRNRYDGASDVREDYRFTVATTPGMRSGQVLTFAGIADQRKDEAAGDVLVTIAVDEHEHFAITNVYDLTHSVGISLLDAFELEYALPKHPNGDDYVIRCKNLEEPLYLVDTKTVPGLGMPKPDGSFGDLVLSFDLQLPSSLKHEDTRPCSTHTWNL